MGGSGNRIEKSESRLRKGSSKLASFGELLFETVRASVLQVDDARDGRKGGDKRRGRRARWGHDGWSFF